MGASRRAAVNWIVNTGISVTVMVLALSWLARIGLHSKDCHSQIAAVPVVCFNVAVSGTGIGILASTYFDTIPLVVQYGVVGRPDIQEVQTSFVHSGRWTTFTVWCNTVGAAYFGLAAIVGSLEVGGYQIHPALNIAVEVLWEITFPMAFLVNLVVTFVLIPGIKKHKPDKLWYILKWRPQAFHNGFVLVTAIEAAIASPCMLLDHVCILVLFGLAYVVFSWIVFARTRVFHYYFLDCRFKLAPIFLVGLLALLTALYCVGCVVVDRAAHSWLWKALIVIAALSTCTWHDPSAVRPRDKHLSNSGDTPKTQVH